jgi:integrase
MTKKSVGIYQRGPSTWRIVVSTGREAADGSYGTIRETVHGSRRDADKRRAELIADVEKGIAVKPGPETVSAFLERYIAHREKLGKVRPSTARTYRGYIARHVAPAIGWMRVSDVRPLHLQRVIDDALDAGLSATSAIQIHRILHGAFRQAVRWQILAVNPSDGVTPPEAKDAELTTPGPAEIARLLEAAEDWYRPALTLSALTGLRRSEVLGLRWADVTLEGEYPELRVRAGLQRIEGKLQLVKPKSEKGGRTVPLPRSAVAMLRAHRVEQNERRLIAGSAWHDGDFVIDNGAGHPMPPDSLTAAFGRARRAANVGGVRLHDLRHGYASTMIKAKVSPKVVSAAMGHATVAFTLQTYVHPDKDQEREAAAAIDAALGQNLGQNRSRR